MITKKLLDTNTLHGIRGMAYDEREANVYFMLISGKIKIVKLNYLIPIEVRKNKLVSRYVRKMEATFNLYVTATLIQLIVSYFPCR